MTLIRYQPWDLFGQVRRDVNRLLETQFGEPLRDDDHCDASASRWTPSVDIKEEAERFVIYADLPGVAVKDIDITMEQGVLTIKGERKWETEAGREDYRHVERARGAFHRRFSLPDSADAERITAKSKDGVVEVVIPKLQKVQPRRIAVQN